MIRRRWLIALVMLAAMIGGGRGAPSVAAPTRADLERAERRLLEIEAEFEIVVEEYNAVHERLLGHQKRMAALDLQMDTLGERLELERSAAVGLARELYMGGGSLDLEAVLSAQTIGEMETRLTYLRSSEEAKARVFLDLLEAHEAHEARLSELERAGARVADDQMELSALREAVESKLQEQRAEIDALTALVRQAEARARQRLRLSAAYRAVRGLPISAIQPEPAGDPKAQTAVDTALAQLGKPYRWAASGPDAFDCSGLTQSSWAAAGVAIPRNSAMQYAALPHISKSDLQPGDLLFYGAPIHHVGMYIGSGQMVHAPYTGSRVRVNYIDRPDYAGAARPR